jgi:hypothetical protein
VAVGAGDAAQFILVSVVSVHESIDGAEAEGTGAIDASIERARRTVLSAARTEGSR